MDPKELYPHYDENDNDPLHSDSEDQFSQKENYGYRKPGAAITSMVLGICSVSLWFYPFITSIPCIIMGWVALRLAKNEEGQVDPRYNGFLKAGRITGTIGMIISILYSIIMAAAIGNILRS